MEILFFVENSGLKTNNFEDEKMLESKQLNTFHSFRPYFNIIYVQRQNPIKSCTTLESLEIFGPMEI